MNAMDTKSHSLRWIVTLAASLAVSGAAFAGQGFAGAGHHGGSAPSGGGAPASGGHVASAPPSASPGNMGREGGGRNYGGPHYSTGHAPSFAPGGTYAGGRPGFTPPRAGFTPPRAGFTPGADRPAFQASNGARMGSVPRTEFHGSADFNNSSRNGSHFAGRGDMTTRPGFVGRPGGNAHVGGTYPGYANHSPGYGNHSHWNGGRHWNGGYWHGGYWPRAYYSTNFVSFWPVLPALYATYWFGGIPYYYANDVYYTWDHDRYGYVVTDPPPAVESGAGADEGAASSSASGSAEIYVYPRNGQSEEQTSNDRYECHQWAVSQTGFDPTNGSSDAQAQGRPDDYRRALMACLDARGYSAN